MSRYSTKAVTLGKYGIVERELLSAADVNQTAVQQHIGFAAKHMSCHLHELPPRFMSLELFYDGELGIRLWRRS